MHYDSSWDHDYCVDPDEWVCYGNCRDCANVCEDGRDLIRMMDEANKKGKEADAIG